jgi:hypothetical protein
VAGGAAKAGWCVASRFFGRYCSRRRNSGQARREIIASRVLRATWRSFCNPQQQNYFPPAKGAAAEYTRAKVIGGVFCVEFLAQSSFRLPTTGLARSPRDLRIRIIGSTARYDSDNVSYSRTGTALEGGVRAGRCHCGRRRARGSRSREYPASA